MKKIELLAPARDLQSGMTAVDYGADAVYIGGPGFGARHAAANTADDIARLVDYARGYGVRVYAALNTVVFEDELIRAEAIARELIGAGVDALIVQDMALLRMGLEGVEFHASTQMCNTTADGVRFLRESGFSRVILERGLTLGQIEEIRQVDDIELECFVHGAICVGFSGRCYLSRSMGPRSGNRGECGQPCRLTYDLTDEKGNVLIAGKHLLSVQDMNLTERIPRLIDAGVSSFKIEGRLKETQYVKNIVAHYRREIDRTIADRQGFVKASSGVTTPDFEPDPNRTFTRGGSLWMLDGKAAGVASFDTPKAIGAYVGEVSAMGRGGFELNGKAGLVPGDGICFIANGELKGTNVNKVEERKIFPNKFEGIVVGTKIYRNYDHAFSMQLQGSRAKRTIDISALVAIHTDGITLKLTDVDGISVEISRTGSYEPAVNPDKMVETIYRQTTKTGDTLFNINSIELITESETVPFIPVAEINELRRQATDTLLTKRKEVMAAHPKNIKTENLGYSYPSERLTGESNVTNSLAEAFYRSHDVVEIAPGFDLSENLTGECVMTSAYCLRRELGWCLKNRTEYRGKLLLKRGAYTYRLEFDCKACRMNIYKSDS